MQVFNLDYEQQENFDMVFQPMTGKAGETVPVMAVTILEPSFVAEGPDNPRYGFHHQESATTSRQISFVADAPRTDIGDSRYGLQCGGSAAGHIRYPGRMGVRLIAWTRQQPCPWV